MQKSNTSSNQQQVQNRLMDLQPQMLEARDATIANYQPYAATGQTGLTATSDLLGLNGQPAADAAMTRYQQSPGYQFQFDEGVRATDAAQAANGMFRSGATGKALEKFGQGLANTDFGTYYNRLAGLAGGGLTAAQGIGSAENSWISGLSGNVQQANTASTGATNAQNSILGNTASGLGNSVNSLFSNQNFQNWVGGGTPAAGTAGGFNNGADLVNPDGSVVLPPTFQPAPVVT
jgi:hypothetical protein